MRGSIKWLPASFGVALLILSGLAFGPCVEKRSIENGLGSFRVTITSVQGFTSGHGTRIDPYGVPNGDVTLTADAVALDQYNQPLDSFAGDIGLKVTPGELADPAQRVQFTAGRADAFQVVVRKTYGQLALWLEDVRWVQQPAEQSPSNVYKTIHQLKPEGTWATGVSNIIYIANPSLRQIQYDDWIYDGGRGENYYSSLDEDFVEINPRIADPAGSFQDGHGQLVVTGVFNEGFFVTDMVDAGDGFGFNHLYAYSFSYPDDLEIGYRLDRLVGTTDDFSGCTQIGFPAWNRAVNEAQDPEPYRVQDLDGLIPPVTITSDMCNAGKADHRCGHSPLNWTLEALESARVRLEHLKTPDIFIDCDFNADLEIPLFVEDGQEQTTIGLELACRDNCLARQDGTMVVKRFATNRETLQAVATSPCASDTECASGQCGGYTEADADDGVCRMVCPWESNIDNIRPNCIQIRIGQNQVCSELSTLEQFGQWTVALEDGAGPLINILTRESVVDFDPTSSEHLGMAIEFVQGNLRQVRAARPRWIVLVGRLAGDTPESLKP